MTTMKDPMRLAEEQGRHAAHNADRHQFVLAGGDALRNAAQSHTLGLEQTLLGVSGMGQPQVKPCKEREGVLMWQGRELPEAWRGAEYKPPERSFYAYSQQWRFTFRSDFSTDAIVLWLDPNKYSGEEADKIAAAYLEMLNQRRLA